MKKKEFDFTDENIPLSIKNQLTDSTNKYKEYFNQSDIGHLIEWEKALDIEIPSS